jgi:hypothetical protein
MTVSKRIRLLRVALVAFNLGEILIACMDLLTDVPPIHVALIYGTQLVFFNLFTISSLRRLKRENQVPMTEEQTHISTWTNPRIKLIFIIVNVSIPLWTIYYASNFSIPFKIMIAAVSAIFLNLALYLAIRSHRPRTKSTEVANS